MILVYLITSYWVKYKKNNINILCNESEKMKKKSSFYLFQIKKNVISLTAKISTCLFVFPLLFKFKTFLTSGNETKCLTEMKKGSTDELEVTVKPAMTGRHVLDIRILDRVVVSKEFESTPGKCSINVFTYIVYRHLYI